MCILYVILLHSDPIVPINYKVNFNISDSSMTYDEEKDTYTLTLEIELPQKYEAYRYVCSFWISDNFGFNRVANLETNRTQVCFSQLDCVVRISDMQKVIHFVYFSSLLISLEW